MDKDYQNERSYKRWALNTQDEHLPLSLQRSGIAVSLRHPWLFNYHICRGVIKDVSFGGAGLLLAAEKKLPKRLIVVFNKSTRLSGVIKYSKVVNEQLQFVGIEWVTKSEQKKADLLAQLQVQPNQAKQYDSDTEKQQL
ncbi:PilZ domain-containing protein [Pseudoalteromonas shioyasakiensis]|uniref:PilZ domain-containing protein n=1 Tax=Pseudoalteromonas shioyasakiensis TaxID=1190813 RepID=UPI0021174B49|nr:PilZ domain-containing protein [Pseudoalteromonas shioyasakiensis]MCQ8877497.1 PilZ domain-containing protein [Pseudoalteromonas shioyasakiensis]